MKALGMDLGTRTLGLATSDRLGMIASPYKTIRYEDINALVDEVLEIIKNEKIEVLVLGYPKNMNNTEGPAVERTNNFKTLLIFITKNSIVENAPKSFFSYWQLLRILKGKPQKIASSQFSSRGSFIKDDPIFDRAFQIETIKDNPNYNKIGFRNYSEFQGIINSDIEFMRQVGAKNFDLLLMYYEYENTQKHEKQGAIKIRQTNKGAEFGEESMPKGFLDEEGGTSLKEKKGSFDGDFLNFGKLLFLEILFKKFVK